MATVCVIIYSWSRRIALVNTEVTQGGGVKRGSTRPNELPWIGYYYQSVAMLYQWTKRDFDVLPGS